MKMYKYIEAKKALKDKQHIKSCSNLIKNKLEYLVKDILYTPHEKDVLGSPEQLKHTDIEIWSRELTKKRWYRSRNKL